MSSRIWIIGKKGMLAQAFKRVCERLGVFFFQTSKEEADITSLPMLDDVAKRESFSHIINCSAYTAVDKAEIEQDKAYSMNEKGAENLAILAQKYGCKIIHFSTDYVFNGRLTRPYEERDFTDPHSVYGKSKLKGEKVLLEGIPHASLVVRTSWLFGKEGYNFPKTMLRLMRQKETVEVVDDQIGRPTYADDLAEVTLKIMNETGLFHFSNHGEVSWFQFAICILKQLQDLAVPLHCKEIVPVTTDQFGAKAPRPRYSVLSTKKIESILKTPIAPFVVRLLDCLKEWNQSGVIHV